MDLNRREYYVYQLRNPVTDEVFYVGKGIKNRLYSHERYVINNNRRDKNPLLFKTIQNILKGGNRVHCLKIKENLTEQEAMIFEIEEILKYGRLNNHTGVLCNMTDGGGGMSGYKHKESTKQYMRQLHSGIRNPFYGQHHDYQTLQRLSFAALGNNHARGLVHSPETKKRLSFLNHGKVVSDETRHKMSQSRSKRPTKAIIQIDQSGNLIKKWKSASEAAKILSFSKQCLSNCLREKQKTYKGFIWKYE